MPAERRPYRQAPEQELLAQMRQSLGLLQVAFDSASDAMVIVDHQLTIRWANQTAADRFSHGLTATLIAQSFAEQIILLPPHGDAKGLDARTLLFTQKDADMHLRVTGHNPHPDHTAPLNIVSWKTITSTKEVFHLVVFRDLDPIEQALEQQRLFVHQLAHELRTPLALLSGSLRRLSRLVTMPGMALKALQTAQSESQRLRNLVDHLMLLSDLETDLFPWNIQEQSINAAVQQWIGHLPDQHQQRVQTTIDPTIQTIRFDSHALGIIFDQLLANSLRFGDQSISISIHIKRSPSGTEVRFEDNGPGMVNTSQDKIESIFNRFQRLEQHRSNTRDEGCGLGLTVAQELMRRMGGTIKHSARNDRSARAHQGTCMVIDFPDQP